MSRIDLHIHSSASDGSLRPAEVVRFAKKNGLQVIALTDHDTTSGLQEALEEGRKQGIEVIPGIELSIEMKGGTFHLLGYGIKETEELQSSLRRFIEGREVRNKKILHKLEKLGMKIDYQELIDAVPGVVPGRPHIARLMLEKGYVNSYQEAFENYLKKGAVAYQDRFRMKDKEGIGLIIDSGGIPVLAHPFSLKMEKEKFEDYLNTLIQYGLKGIEAYYTKHTKEQQKYYLKIAKEYRLLVTGGSDFHGDSKPRIMIGKGYGELEIPYHLYLNLKKAIKDMHNL